MLPVRRTEYRTPRYDPIELMRRDLGRVFGYWPESGTRDCGTDG